METNIPRQSSLSANRATTLIDLSLPSDPNLEESVLGSLMVHNEAIADVQKILTVDSFSLGKHREIFKAIIDLRENESPVDILTIAESLKQKGKLDEIGGESFLGELAEKSFGAVPNIIAHAKILQKKERLRNLIEECVRVSSEAYKDDASPTALFDKLKSMAPRFEKPGAGYNLTQWSLSRFSGEPEPEKFLIENFIPQGIAGTMYSAGGSGKSTLSIDLSLRVAIAGSMPTMWLGKFKVQDGRRILYISAEEPENILHRRIQGLAAAIAIENGISTETLLNIALPNLFIVNVWGEARQLFELKGASIIPTNEYYRILRTLEDENIGLLVIDTRSRLSAAEGAGNAIVSSEVAFYEQWAAKSGATVLVLHHTNKASYGGLAHAQAAQRGESAFADCLRFGIYLQTMTEETAAGNGINDNERRNYLAVVHAKSNYTAIQEPLILHRNGWNFELTDLKLKSAHEGKKARQSETDLIEIVQAVREKPGINQRALIEQLSDRLSSGRVRCGIKYAIDCNYLIVTPGDRGTFHYTLNELNEPP